MTTMNKATILILLWNQNDFWIITQTRCSAINWAKLTFSLQHTSQKTARKQNFFNCQSLSSVPRRRRQHIKSFISSVQVSMLLILSVHLEILWFSVQTGDFYLFPSLTENVKQWETRSCLHFFLFRKYAMSWLKRIPTESLPWSKLWWPKQIDHIRTKKVCCKVIMQRWSCLWAGAPIQPLALPSILQSLWWRTLSQGLDKCPVF